MGPDDDPVGECLDQLRRAGWSVGDAAFTGKGGALVWGVTGSNGENLIRAEGPTRAAAWLAARIQVGALGMLGPRSRPLPGKAGEGLRWQADKSQQPSEEAIDI
jgi:hypothetical protein